MPTLFVASGRYSGRKYEVTYQEPLVVGREETLKAQVIDGGISRQHFHIIFDESQTAYLVADLGSKNGTFLNGKRLLEATPLQSRDVIRIGETDLLFTMKDFETQEEAEEYFKEQGESELPTLEKTAPEVKDAIKKLKEMQD